MVLFSTSGIQYYPLGDAAIVLHFGDSINPKIHNAIQNFAFYLDTHPFFGMVEYVPAFTTLTIYYDPWQISEHGKYDPYQKAVSAITHLIEQVKIKEKHAHKAVKIPVCYGDEFGPDLDFVASHTHLSAQEVISIHSSVEYLVYMIGFAPGFPYLGGMNQQLATPRKSMPRTKIPKGSVGIAGAQTGIYPIETPGGWQLIGRTPLALFNAYALPPSLLQAGDLVRFIPITKEEYQIMKGAQK